MTVGSAMKVENVKNERGLEEGQSWTINKLLIASGIIRLVLVLYARIHDYIFKVRFTDIDYDVYSDAAAYAYSGGSPYDRATYRYTPLLAYLLIPNAFCAEFGKLLFCATDLLVGALAYELLLKRKGVSERAALWCIGVFWLFNPLTAVISARGNADVTVCASVLLVLYLLESGNWLLGAVVHGCLAIHLKLYPVIYLPSIFLFLAEAPIVGDWKEFGRRVLLNFRGASFAAISIAGFAVMTALCYYFFGDRFLEESLLYHVSRTDTRHNFSPYFYPLYLVESDRYLSKIIGGSAFIPQALMIVVFALRYSNDLPFCWLLTTVCFVALNKVCTSQYFVWYLCLLPLALPNVSANLSSQKAVFMAASWFGAQGLWLLAAYLLEFQGMNTFVLVWLCSLILLVVNFWLVVVFVRSYTYLPRVTTAKKME
uniref:GPI alpha-1,4-mannosyltransferase I, catalytic subunit n=1 Tax=Plectus sambesii TaxID=2011161 RepID=A0A914WWV9_9BILA